MAAFIEVTNKYGTLLLDIDRIITVMTDTGGETRIRYCFSSNEVDNESGIVLSNEDVKEIYARIKYAQRLSQTTYINEK